jgi:hypothetical protein
MRSEEKRISLRKHEIELIEAPVGEGGPLCNEDVFAQGIRILLYTLDLEF